MYSFQGSGAHPGAYCLSPYHNVVNAKYYSSLLTVIFLLGFPGGFPQVCIYLIIFKVFKKLVSFGWMIPDYHVVPFKSSHFNILDSLAPTIFYWLYISHKTKRLLPNICKHTHIIEVQSQLIGLAYMNLFLLLFSIFC